MTFILFSNADFILEHIAINSLAMKLILNLTFTYINILHMAIKVLKAFSGRNCFSLRRLISYM